MSLRNTFVSYGSVSKFFHWTVSFLVICMLIFGYCLSYVPKDYQGFAYNTHKLTGLTILLLMVLRLLWTLTNPKPVSLNPYLWERIAERSVHWMLYAFVICMPIAGWIGASSAGKAPRIGDLQLALPIQKNKALIENSFDVHNTVAIVIIGLVSIHFLAAMYHHFFKKDNTLRRMLPR